RARAQDATTGAIDGVVESSGRAPLAGVRVQVTSPNLQGVRVARSDGGGRFHVPSLPPGTYLLTARLAGFMPVDAAGVQVSLASTAWVPVSMHVASSAEIEVTGDTPFLDVRSATGGQNVREDLVQRLPVGRNYADVLRLVPGVATDDAETQGRGVPFTIHGATSLENQYLVDGANTTNVIKGFQGKALPNEFIEEVQIKSSGSGAQYGGGRGGIVNVVTKSGGNELHGDVFGSFGARSLTSASEARPDTDAVYVDRTSEDRRDYGLDVGGPFLKDR